MGNWKKLLFLFVVVNLLSGCSSSNQESALIEVPTPNQTSTNIDELTSTLKDFLKNDFRDVYATPYFADGRTLEVISGDGFKNLEVSVDSIIHIDGIKDGSVSAETIISLDSSPTDFLKIKFCAKDAFQEFAGQIIFDLFHEYPTEGLKIKMRFLTTDITTTRTDKYGHTFSFNVKGKLISSSSVQISRANLDKIDNPLAVPDYFALSDLTSPSRYLSSWNRCSKHRLA